ncbi:sensor domain-containing diguanylate cyclase [Leucothrix sargassi]|nr:sensor domain-containing diguanylate cyclase [Leucothrix sargassi]
MDASLDSVYRCAKQKTLKSVLFSEFLRKALIPIIFVEVVLIVLYFSSVHYMVDKTVEVMSQTAKQSLINMSDVEARYMSNRLKFIARKTQEFQQKYNTGQSFQMSSFATQTLPTDLPWKSGALLLDENNNVLVTSSAIQGLYDESDIALASDNQEKSFIKQGFIASPPTLETEVEKFIAEQSRSKEFEAHGEQYFVTQNLIKESGWRLVILTHMKSIYAPIYQQKSESQNLGIFVTLIIINFYIAFFIYLLIASQRFSNRITQPIRKVSQLISQMSKGNTEINEPVSYVQIKELDELIDLNAEIQETKDKYQKISIEMQHKNEQLERLAVTDTLTKTYNRLKLDEALSYEIARARRDKNPVSTILLDIDRFKKINDTHGHLAGDKILVGIAKLLKQSLRRTDILGRWGGEEFLVIMPNTNLENASTQANKLRCLIEGHYFDGVGKITASFGVSSCMGNCNEQELIEISDQALYKAKELGRNQVQSQEAGMPVKLQLVESKERVKKAT